MRTVGAIGQRHEQMIFEVFADAGERVARLDAGSADFIGGPDAGEQQQMR